MKLGEMLKFECGQWKVSLKMTIRQITTMGEKVDFYFFVKQGKHFSFWNVSMYRDLKYFFVSEVWKGI